MCLDELVSKSGISMYELASRTGISIAKINDICKGMTISVKDSFWITNEHLIF